MLFIMTTTPGPLIPFITSMLRLLFTLFCLAPAARANIVDINACNQCLRLEQEGVD
jgi:hypothetical protein